MATRGVNLLERPEELEQAEDCYWRAVNTYTLSKVRTAVFFIEA